MPVIPSVVQGSGLLLPLSRVETFGSRIDNTAYICVTELKVSVDNYYVCYSICRRNTVTNGCIYSYSFPFRHSDTITISFTLLLLYKIKSCNISSVIDYLVMIRHHDTLCIGDFLLSSRRSRLIHHTIIMPQMLKQTFVRWL
jgi:hypothetical protein